MRRNRRLPLILALVVLLGMLGWGVGLYTDWLWFASLGYLGVLQRTLAIQVGLFFAGALLFLAILGGNVWLARALSARYEPPFTIRGGDIWFDDAPRPRVPTRLLATAGLTLALLVALIMGTSALRQWDGVLRFALGQPFGVVDPLFGQDVGLYVFAIPFYRFAVSWLMGALTMTLIAVAAIYAFRYYGMTLLRSGRLPYDLARPIKGHLAVLGAALLLLLSVSYRLEIFELVYSPLGVVFGAGYTDVNAHLPALNVLSIVVLLGAGLLVAYAFTSRLWMPLLGIGLWLVVLLLGNVAYPFLVQKAIVEPSELTHERPFIEQNIRMTRLAYGLDSVQEQAFPAEPMPSKEAISSNPGTVDNIRLWDHRPLLDTYNQIQAIRGYYEFTDVDIDRYVIDGRYRQVMLSARELVTDKLPNEAKTWQSLRLQYTHGYGVAMSPVNEITGEGLPTLFLRDVPPTGVLPVTRPEIYHGERTDGYVIVNTQIKEFDYPSGSENVFSQYQGKGGVEIGPLFNRLAFAWRFAESNILLSNFLTNESRVLFHRNVQDRVRMLAPYLTLDRDPYIVLHDGRLFWIQDAYTTSDKYPYAEPYNRRLNYIRNSVKAVVDAYSGEVNFYIAEPADPLVKVYAAAFPELYKPLSAMPEGLRLHLRYPEDMFLIQVEMYRTYHMQDPQVFYLREDQWNVPREIFQDKEQPVEPYYVIMRLPDSNREEFLLMLPMTPPARQNVIAWLAARSDGDNYGNLLVYNFPKDKLVYGPLQVEGRISQDPVISSQFALWNQAGSRVIRGNLLLIPIGNSNIYVEPVYLRAVNGTIPELKRVVVAAGDKIAMEPTLGAALARLFDVQVGQPTQPPPTQPPPGQGQPDNVGDLIRQANEVYGRAEEQLRQGDWAGYGESQRRLKDLLQRLQAVAGSR